MPVTHIDQALVSLLTAATGVTNLVSTRIYATQAPQGSALPAIVYVRDTGNRALGAHMLGHSGLLRASYTVTCLGTTLLAVRNLTRQVRLALQYKSNSDLRLVQVTDDNDTQEPPTTGEQLPIYRTDLTVEVTYTES
jgi:hypothetical protein